MAFEGSCHCGAVAFSVDAPIPEEALSCNCSICRRNGSLLAFFPVEHFKLTKGDGALRSYTFNTHRITHQFCETCGAEPFARATSPDGKDVRAVNLRCVMEVDLDALTVNHYDGASK